MGCGNLANVYSDSRASERARSQGLDLASLPGHVGVIMDGNGRWAKARQLPRLAGHRKGVERVDEITTCACELGLHALTLFAFSNENWKRPEDEVTGLMGLLRWYLRAERKKILQNNIVFRVIGERRKLSSDILRQVEDLEVQSSSNNGMHLTIALSYGSRSEIVRAVARLAEEVASGRLYASDIDEETFESFLDTHGLPPLDLVIRTSGEFRLSNFLLYQAAYAELSFDDAFWPDFDADRFCYHLREYARRDRRFGNVKDPAMAVCASGAKMPDRTDPMGTEAAVAVTSIRA
jgi:undecaprenyl diphosphate synthase